MQYLFVSELPMKTRWQGRVFSSYNHLVMFCKTDKTGQNLVESGSDKFWSVQCHSTSCNVPHF